VSALFVIGWNIVWTSLIMVFIKYVLRVPLRMTDAACEIGDYAVHREESYTFAYYNRDLLPRRGVEDLEGGIHGLIMGRPLPEPAQHTGQPKRSGEIRDIGTLDEAGSSTPEKKAVETKKEA
jgi:Amt family ammonium transporter